MTVPPPPAVPGELIEKAREALTRSRCVFSGDAIVVVLAAVYGDIVEAARRDGAAELVARVDDLRVSLSPFSDYWRGYVDALSHVADLAYVPAASLSATHADPTPVPRIPRTDGAQKRSEGRGDE